MFTFKRVYYKSTCSSNPDPPSPVDPLPDIIVSYCTVFIYDLPATLFHDTQDGETKYMALSLLDANGKDFDFLTITLLFKTSARKKSFNHFEFIQFWLSFNHFD